MRYFAHGDKDPREPVRARHSFRAPILIIGLTLAAVSIVPAATDIWINTAGGAWEDTTSWNLGAVPGPSDDVRVGSNGSYTVTIGSSAASTVPNSFTNSTLQVNGLGSGSPTLELTYTNAMTFAVTNGLQVGNGTLNVNIANWILSVTNSSFTDFFFVNSTLGTQGVVNVYAGTVNAQTFRLGQVNKSISTLNIFSGGTFTGPGILGVGTNSTGVIQLQGGTFTFNNNTTLGFAGGSTGRVVVSSGLLKEIDNGGINMIIGNGGTNSLGQLIISNGFVNVAAALVVGGGVGSSRGEILLYGGSLSNVATTRQILFGTGNGSTGLVLVAGSTATWDLNVDRTPLRLGLTNGGVGIVTVSNGTVRVISPSPTGFSGSINVGDTLGSGTFGSSQFNIAGGTALLTNSAPE